MALRCVVLDFDGTLTDGEASGRAFEEAYPGILGELVRHPVTDHWAETRAAVARDAPEAAWAVDGHAAAPADADVYLLDACTAHRVLDAQGLLPDPVQRDDVMTRAYQRAYRQVETVFRPEAAAVLRELVERGLAVTVVTNASGDVVDRKLSALVPDLRGRFAVHGDARKFLVDPALADVPERIRVDGLRRGVLLRRRAYLDALRGVWGRAACAPSEAIVCGDIYEMDLALPATLGASVHLVLRPTTHPYERDAVAALGARGGVSSSLSGLLARVR